MTYFTPASATEQTATEFDMPVTLEKEGQVWHFFPNSPQPVNGQAIAQILKMNASRVMTD
jgi:hypothetical protein